MDITQEEYEAAMNYLPLVDPPFIRFVLCIVQTDRDGTIIRESIKPANAGPTAYVRRLEIHFRLRYNLPDEEWSVRFCFNRTVLHPFHTISTAGIVHGSIVACHISPI